MQYEIDLEGMQDSLYEEMLAIDEECRNLNDRLKALRKRNKKLSELFNELSTAADIGRLHPKVLEKIYEHFGPDSVKII